MNKVFIMGNVTRDPEKRYTPSGAAVSEITVAVNRRYKAASGEMKDESCFVPVTLWGKMADNAVEHLNKGSQVLVEGRLKLDRWEKDGVQKSKLSVVCENIQFLSRYGKGGGSGGAPRQAPDRTEHREPPPTGPAWDAPAPSGEAPPDDLPF